jgi:hypothetical protein
MRQVDKAAAEHLLSPFSSPFLGMKLLYDYGFRGQIVQGTQYPYNFVGGHIGQGRIDISPLLLPLVSIFIGTVEEDFCTKDMKCFCKIN